MHNKNKLAGQVAVVTGGNGGLGFAMAMALKEAGADVIVWGRNETKLIQSSLLGLTAMQVDVSIEEEVILGFKQVIDKFSKLDILINNAGIYEDQILTDMSYTDWNRLIQNNLSSVFLCSQQAAGNMKIHQRGKIINLGSMYSLFGHPHSVGYATTKTAILGFTRALAAELGPWNIQVNAILPGWFQTAINGALPDTARGEEIRKKTPLGRWGEATDIGPLAVFLSSEEANFITGVTIPLDGGYSISDRQIW